MPPAFKLGPAILKTDDSTGHVVPDTWRADLLRKLDSRSRAAVAQVCS